MKILQDGDMQSKPRFLNEKVFSLGKYSFAKPISKQAKHHQKKLTLRTSNSFQ